MGSPLVKQWAAASQTPLRVQTLGCTELVESKTMGVKVVQKYFNDLDLLKLCHSCLFSRLVFYIFNPLFFNCGI